MAKLLTKSKHKWAKQFKPKVLRGEALNPNLSDALRYKKRLDKYITRMVDDVEKQLKKLFKTEEATEYFTTDASLSSQARILTNALIDKYNEMFARISKPLAEQAVNEAEVASSASLHSSLQALSGGLSLKTSSISPDVLEVMNASVVANVALIKSISHQYLNGVQQAVMRSITTGNGLQELIPYLQKHRGITYRRARMIAYDQTRKAFNGISRGKMDRLGIKKYEWLHSGGSNEPRKLHIKLSGHIFSLDDPPVIDEDTGERGIPGQLVNCGCRMLPVIEFE